MADDNASVGDASSLTSDKTSGKDAANSTTPASLVARTSVLDGIMGVMFALTQNFKPPSRRYAVFRTIVDWLQLLAFVLSDRFPFAVWALRILKQYVTQLQFANPLKDFGYDAWASAFWILTVLLLSCVGLCIYVAADFQRDTFSAVWPVKVVRSVLSVFFSLFFTSSLNVFLTSISCDWTAAEPTLLGFQTADGTAIPCFSGGNAVYAVVGVLMAVLFIGIAALLTIVDFERDFLSMNPLAMPSSRPEFTIFLCKISFTLSSVILGQYLLPLAICYSVISATMAYTTLRYLPFLRGWANQLKFTLYGLLCFEALVAVAVTIVNDTADNIPTIMAIAGVPFLAAALVWASSSRLETSDGRWLVIDATAETDSRVAARASLAAGDTLAAPHVAVPPKLSAGAAFSLKKVGEVPPSHLLQVRTVFSTPLDVEIAARFAMQSGLRTPGWVRAADRIYRHGLALFPNSSYLHLAYASFLTATNAPGNISTAKIHTERARRCKPAFADLFALFVRDTKRKHMAQSEAVGADQDMDLVSYVEFSHQLSLVQKTHRATLKAVRRFWKAILAIQAAGGEITIGSGVPGEETKTVTASTAVQYSSQRRGVSSSEQQQQQAHWAATKQPGAASRASSGKGSKRQNRAKAYLETLGASSDNAQVNARSITIAVDADMLAKLFLRIDNLEGKARAIYGVLLDKYPKSPKLLRAHGRFQRDVLRETRESDRCFSEAQRIEDMQRDAASPEGRGIGAGTINAASDSLIVINDRGTITTANKPAATMFRTTVSQLVGKPVGMLMEAARAAQHGAYMREYLNTGVTHIIGKPRRVWAKRFDNSVFPVELSVSQIDDGMGGIAFAGVLMELPEDATLVRLTMTDTGIITSASCGIEGMFGLRVPDIIRRKLSVLLPTGSPMVTAEDIENRFKVNSAVKASALHKNMSTFPVEVTLRLLDVRPTAYRKKMSLRASGSDQAMGSRIGSRTVMTKAKGAPKDGYEVIVKELVGEYGLVSISEKGEIISVSTGALQLFGYDDEQELLGRNVNMLMPLPYRAFHDSYLRRYMATGAATVVGKAPRSVPGVRRDGRKIGVMLEVKETTPDKDASNAGGSGGGALRNKDGKTDASSSSSAAAPLGAAEIEEEELGLDVGRPKFQRLFTAKLVLLKSADAFEKEVHDATASNVSSAEPTSASAAVISESGAADLRGSGGGGCPMLHDRSGDAGMQDDAKAQSPASVSQLAAASAATPLNDRAAMDDGATSSGLPTPKNSSAKITVPSSVPRLKSLTGSAALNQTTMGGTSHRARKSSLSQRSRLYVDEHKQQAASKCPFHLPVPEAGLPEVRDRDIKTMSGRMPVDFDEWEARARQHVAELDSDPLRAVVLADRTSRIVFANAKVGSLFGISAHKLVGHSVAVFCPPEIATRHDELVQRYRSTRSPHVIGTPGRHVVARKAGGSLFPVSLLMDEADPAIKAALVYRAKLERSQRRVAKAAMENVDDEQQQQHQQHQQASVASSPGAATSNSRDNRRASLLAAKEAAKAAQVVSDAVAADSHAYESKDTRDDGDVGAGGVSLRAILLQCLQEASAPAGPFGEALVPGSLALKHHVAQRARDREAASRSANASATSLTASQDTPAQLEDATAIPAQNSEADASGAVEGEKSPKSAADSLEHAGDSEVAAGDSAVGKEPVIDVAAAMALADAKQSSSSSADADAAAIAVDEAQLASQGGVGANNTYVHQYDKTKPILGFVAYLYGLDELEATVTVDDELVIRHTNAAMWHVTGLYTSELRGSLLSRLFPDEDFADVLAAAKRRKRREDAVSKALTGGEGDGRAADDDVVDHLMSEVKKAAAAGISPLDLLAQGGGDSDDESVEDAAAMKQDKSGAAVAKPRIKLPVPELVGGRKTIELRHRIGDNVTVLVEFAEVHVPRGENPVTTMPLESSFEVSAHRHKSRSKSVLASKPGGSASAQAAAVAAAAGGGGGIDSRSGTDADVDDDDAAKITYDVYYTGRIVLATASRQDIEARARSVAKSVLKNKKKRRKKQQEKQRLRKAKRLGTKTGREIADSDLPGYEGRRQTELAAALGLGGKSRRPGADEAGDSAQQAADATEAVAGATTSSGMGMARVKSFSVYKSTAAPDAIRQRAELRKQGKLRVRFSQETIEHDESRQQNTSAKYYPKEGKTIARTKTLIRLASHGSVGSAAAASAATGEEELRLTGPDADKLSESSTSQPNSSRVASARGQAADIAAAVGSAGSGLDVTSVEDADHDTDPGASEDGDHDADNSDHDADHPVGLDDQARGAASSHQANGRKASEASTKSHVSGESSEQSTGRMQRMQSQGAMSTGGESEMSDASDGSARTGSTMASALDRYLMGEDQSDATSRDDSDLSGDGSSVGSGSHGWRVGEMSSDGQSGVDTEGEGDGHGMSHKLGRGDDDFGDEEVDAEELLAKRQRQSERLRSRQRHLKRLQRNQRLSSSVANLRALSMWLLLGFMAVFAVPYASLIAQDGQYSALVRAQFIAGRLQEAVLRESIVLGRLEWETSDSTRASTTLAGSVASWDSSTGWVFTGNNHLVTPKMLQAEAGITAQEIATLHRALILGAQHATVATGGEALAASAQALDPGSLDAVVPLATRLESVSAGLAALSSGLSDLPSAIGQGTSTVRMLFDGSPSLVRYEQSSTSLFELGELYWRSAAELAAPVNGSVSLPNPTNLASAVMQPYPGRNASQSIVGIETAIDGTTYGVDSEVVATSSGYPPLPAVVSARQQSWINGTAEFWAVLDNGATSFISGLVSVTEARQSSVLGTLDTLIGMVGAALALETIIPLFALVCMLQPAFARISKERVDTFKVFLRVDQSVVLRLSKMAVKVENKGSESDSSSDDNTGGGGAGHGGGGQHQTGLKTGSGSKLSMDGAGVSDTATAVSGNEHQQNGVGSSGPNTEIGDAASLVSEGSLHAAARGQAASGPPSRLVSFVGEAEGAAGSQSVSDVAIPLDSTQSHDLPDTEIVASVSPAGRPGGTAVESMTATVDATAVQKPAGVLGATNTMFSGAVAPAASELAGSQRTEEGPAVDPADAKAGIDPSALLTIDAPQADAKHADPGPLSASHTPFAGSPVMVVSGIKDTSPESSAFGINSKTGTATPLQYTMSPGYEFGASSSRPVAGAPVIGPRRRRQSSVFGLLAARLARLASVEGNGNAWADGAISPTAGGSSSSFDEQQGRSCFSSTCARAGAWCNRVTGGSRSGSLPRSMQLSALGLLAIVVVASCISLILLAATRNLSHDLYLAGQRSSAAAATQLWALRLVTAASRGAPTSVIAEARTQLEANAAVLEATHNEILFGNAAGAGSNAASLTGVPRSGTESSRLFEPSCLRSETRPGACLNAQHPFAAVSLSGMHGLLQRFVAESKALALQPAADLARGPAYNDAFLLVWTAGEADLRDGLQASAVDYEIAVITLLNVRRLTDSLALIALVGATVSIYLFIVQPFIERISAETHRAARMVSLLPAEVDIRTLIPRRRRARQQAATA